MASMNSKLRRAPITLTLGTSVATTEPEVIMAIKPTIEAMYPSTPSRTEYRDPPPIHPGSDPEDEDEDDVFEDDDEEEDADEDEDVED
jgi:hypothetical protein